MRLSFAQKFNQEQYFESEVAKKWGYTMNSSSMQSSKVSVSTPRQINVNRSFRPLFSKNIGMNLSAKHQKLIKQIDQSREEKRLESESALLNFGKERNVIKLMNERIREYNSLVDHKHLKQRINIEQGLNEQKQSDCESILEIIKIKNNLLLQTQDLNEQVQINKEITKLYKLYKIKVLEQKSRTTSKKQQNVINFKQKNVTNFTVFGDELGFTRKNSVSSPIRHRNHSQFVSASKSKIFIKSNSHDNQNMISKTKFEQLNYEQPFLNRQQIRKNNEIERREELNKEIVDIYKGKISKIAEQTAKKSKAKSEKGKRKIKLDLSLKKEEELDKKLSPFAEMLQKSRTSKIDDDVYQQITQKRKVQEKYFSTFFQKRNRKYKKPWGNKILVKYNGEGQAKQILQGKSNSNVTSFYNNKPETKQRKSTSLHNITKQLTDDQKMLLESMNEQKGNHELYEIMCKNEKINLFLKPKHKH